MVCSQQSPEKTDGHQSQERGGEGARERERESEREIYCELDDKGREQG